MRVISDNDDPFGVLYRTHAARLFALARRYAPPDVAEDLVADAFVVALRRHNDFPRDPMEAFAWLVGTVRKLAANQHRRTASFEKYWREAVRSYWTETSAVSPEDAATEREACLAALARLSESDRQLLLLVAWDGLSPEQAAGALGITRRTLAVRLHRARQRLSMNLISQPDHPAAATTECPR